MASHRRTVAAACAVILASVSLYPIFIGTGWFWAGCGSALVVALTGTATRLRRLPVSVTLLAGVVALLLYLNLAFANARSLYHLLPTPRSIAALWDTAGQGFHQAAIYAPPVPELRGMVLLAAAGIGIAALLTDLIAVRLGSAALAGLPLLLLFTEPFTLSVSRGIAGTTLAFIIGVAGYLALLSSEGRDRIRDWERTDATDHYAPDTRPLAAAGRRVGTVSVVLALCLPLFIPGLHTTRLFGGQPGIGGKGGSGGATLGFPNPNVQLSQELHTAKASTVLTYTTTNPGNPGYLRIYALDQLTDDKGWQLFGQPESLVLVNPRLPVAPGLTETSGVSAQSTKITIARGVGDDQLSALPVPYPATSITVKGGVRADRATLMVFDSGTALSGLSYTVTSLTEAPGAQRLSAAPSAAPSITSHDLSVPADYRPLRALAQSVARGAKTQFDEAVALQNWLAGGSFKYTLNAPSVVTAGGLINFLEVTKKGYCQQFSSAMAVLARLLGIPARVAYGFTPGSPNVTGTFRVTTHDAHSWPELFFQGYGWLRFEPTPSGTAGQGTAFAPTYSVTPGGLTGPPGLATGPTSSPGATATGLPARLRPPPNVALNQGFPGINGTATGASRHAESPWEIAGLVAAGLLALALIAPWCARLVVRRLRWRRGRRPRATGPVVIGADGTAGTAGTSGTNGAFGAGGGGGTAVAVRPELAALAGLSAREARVRARDIAWAHAAWEELRDDLMDYGAGYLPSESPRAVATRAGEGLALTGTARVALGRIAMAEERARYAPAPADGSGLRADSVAVRRAIAAAVPRGTRWRARLLPSSVLGPVLAMAASAANPYRGRIGTEGSRQLGLERFGKFRRRGS
jgi:transglutaminase-like putative cysteine protease